MTDVPLVLRSLLAEAFPNSPRLVRTFEDLVAALLEAKATAEAAAAGSVQLAEVLLTKGSEAFEFGRVLAAGDGLALDLDTDGAALVTVDDTIPRIDGGHSVTFITTGETALLLPETGQVATIADVGTVASGYEPVIAPGTTAQYWRGDKTWQNLTAGAVAFTPAGGIAAATVQAAIAELDTEKLNAASYTAADVLAKLLTVDGSGSGLDADLLDAQSGAFYLARGNHTGTQLAATISDFAEAVDDRAAALIQNGTGITWTYNDALGTLTPAVSITQYTDELAQDAVGTILTDSATIDFTYDDAGGTITAIIKPASVTVAMLAATTGTGNVVLSASPTLTGTLAGASATFTGTLAVNGNVTLGDAITDAHTVNGTMGVTSNLTIGTGASTPQLILNGGDASGAGPYIRVNKNGAVIGYFGAASGVAGGTSNDMLWHAIAGNSLLLHANGALTATVSGTAVNLATGKALQVNAVQVVGARKTGWATATGTATRTTFATTTVTLPQLAERVKALIDDLHGTAGHGLIGT